MPIAAPHTPATKAILPFLLSLLLALAAPHLCGQSVLGTWQGTLPSGPDPRIVVKLAEGADKTLKGCLIFIDRSPLGVPLLTASFTRPDLTLAVADISFHGTLSADAHTFSGTWTRGGQTAPLTFTLATPETLWAYTGPAALAPMPASANPVFEVATIKPSRPDAKGLAIIARNHIFQAKNASATDLIKFAYRLRDRQIQGGPSWKDDVKFDISAEPDTPGQPNPDQARSMLRKLLAERFGLQFHITHPVFAVYALRLDKASSKLSPGNSDSNGYGSIYLREQPDGNTAVQFAWMSMPEFLNTLMNFVPDRQIVDETGLSGFFDFTLYIPTATLQGKGNPEDMDTASAFLAALPRAGFKITPQREPLETVVIDRLDKPSAN